MCATVDFLPEEPKPRNGRQRRSFELSELKIVEDAANHDVRDEEK
jgi:hypothetical protein